MLVASVATDHWKKAVKIGISLFRRGFNSSKCKTMAKMAVARIKLLRNKREVVVRQMRRDIAMLLESKQDATARVRVEHVIREQNIMAANEFIELFCDLIVARLPMIARQRDCPADLKEGISSLIFAAPRCSDIPELLAIRDVFEKKYGKDFVSAAADLRPNAGVNRMLIDKLSVRTPTGEVKMKVMKEIAKEYKVEWDTTESEMELLKPPEERIEGPTAFVSAANLPVKPIPNQSVEQNNPISKCRIDGECNIMQFEDSASAAEAAAESAKKAIAAADAAAYLAGKEMHAPGLNDNLNGATIKNASSQMRGHQLKVQKNTKWMSSGNFHYSNNGSMNNKVDNRKIYRRHDCNIPLARSDFKFDESYHNEEIEMEELPNGIDLLSPNQAAEIDDRKIYKRHVFIPSAHSSIKFDESDPDDDYKTEEALNQPPNRAAPQAPIMQPKQDLTPRVHPKLPDYDTLTAHFEALKHHKSQT